LSDPASFPADAGSKLTVRGNLLAVIDAAGRMEAMSARVPLGTPRSERRADSLHRQIGPSVPIQRSPLPVVSSKAAGANTGTQQGRMRHANVSTTMNVYGRASMKAKSEANRKVVQRTLSGRAICA
jgi:integrase